MKQLTINEASKNSPMIDLHLRTIYDMNLKAIKSFVATIDELPRFESDNFQTRKKLREMRDHSILACLISIQELTTKCLEYEDEIKPDYVEKLKIKELSALGSMLIARYSHRHWRGVVEQFMRKLFPIIYPEYEEVFEPKPKKEEDVPKEFNKIKVSKDIAVALKEILKETNGDKDKILRLHSAGDLPEDYSLLHWLSNFELAEALIKGYEVE